MRNIAADTITQAVITRQAHAPDARLRARMTRLVPHRDAVARADGPGDRGLDGDDAVPFDTLDFNFIPEKA